MQLPAVFLASENCDGHLRRTFELYRGKTGGNASFETYLDNLYPLDWYVAIACLEGNESAWEHLFASRAGRA